MIALAIAGGLCGCSGPLVPVPVAPKPDASLLSACERPRAVDINASDNDIALAWLDAVQRYLECERRHADLAKFVRSQP